MTHLAVIVSGRRNGKARKVKKQLLDWVERGKHVHSVSPRETVCYNGECVPLRRAIIEDVEDLRR